MKLFFLPEEGVFSGMGVVSVGGMVYEIIKIYSEKL
jgi:hypothetical protein